MPANTTPDNIPYPVSTDAVAPLETVFANMANGLQTALTGTKVARPADLTALAALTATNGAAAVVTEGGAVFVANGTIWVQTDPAVFATTTARDTAYAKASAAYRVAGAQAVISTAPMVLMQYNGSGWQKYGLNRPSAAVTTGGTATINDDGSVTLAGSTQVVFTNAFLATAVYDTDNYDIEISGTMPTAGGVQMKLASAGTIDAGTVVYDTYGQVFSQAGVGSAASVLGYQPWFISNGIACTFFEATIELRHANVAVQTQGFVRANGGATLGTAMSTMVMGIDHRAATAFDGFSLIFSNAFNGTVKIKPRV